MDLLSMVEQVEGSTQKIKAEGNADVVLQGLQENSTQKSINDQYQNYIEQNKNGLLDQINLFNQNIIPTLVTAKENINRGKPTDIDFPISVPQKDYKAQYKNLETKEIPKTAVNGDSSLIQSNVSISTSLPYEVKYGDFKTYTVDSNNQWSIYANLKTENIPKNDKLDIYDELKTNEIETEDQWSIYANLKTENIPKNDKLDIYDELKTNKIETEDQWSIYANLKTSEITKENLWDKYKDFQLSTIYKSDIDSKKLKIKAETNQTENVPLYSAEGSWDETDSSFIGQLPIIGDVKGKVDTTLGSSLLFKSFSGEQYAKVTRDPHHLLQKLTWANANIVGMAGRFVPQPPILGSAKYLASSTTNTGIDGLDSTVNSLKDKINQFASTIPSYPFIPLPSFKASNPDYIKPISANEQSISRYGFENPLHSQPLTENVMVERVKNEIPDFDYSAIDKFEGRVAKYSIAISRPEGLYESELPDFYDKINGVDLSNYTTIKEIPSAQISEQDKFKMGLFGDYLLSIAFNDYVAEIDTITKETAECSCYRWGKEYLKYLYGSENTVDGINNLQHRSIYKGYYNIKIYKIYYNGQSNNQWLQRIVESRIFYGVPTYDLTEKLDNTKLQDFSIKWKIIGLENPIKEIQYVNVDNTEPSFKGYGKWEKM